ncbi:DUF6602 domain-containing protein [Microbacterium sp. cx-59]|uniref:DUF6602 domain-containing protein n=1 Tax=Microbacterium sp. cx-59 TaxID=2891207 RepID=UPI0027DF6D8B|nr:DUF6602 domain-containing protein [Microbacterium sp. cx-59]
MDRLQQWFDDADAGMSASYAENHAKARQSQRIQQTGHAAEHAWGQLLSSWLPPQYEVAYRRYILPEIDVEHYTPRETDIVILRPGYPQALRQKEEVLAAGVAAAFSVKLTLDAAGLKEAVEEAAAVRRHVAPRLGTVRQEATPPFRYGVLAHAHAFGKNARSNVASNYAGADGQFARHPRESLDLICVADLGAWSKMTTSYIPIWNEAERLKGNLVVDRHAVTTTLLDAETSQSVNHPHPDGVTGLAKSASPLSVFISELYSFLAQEDEVAEPFHRGLLGTEISASGSGTSRVWELVDVFQPATLDSLPRRLVNGRDREWSMTY